MIETRLKGCSLSQKCDSIVFILETHKFALWRPVKTQVKYRIMRQFIRVCSVCKDKNDIKRKKNTKLY